MEWDTEAIGYSVELYVNKRVSFPKTAMSIGKMSIGKHKTQTNKFSKYSFIRNIIIAKEDKSTEI